MISNEKAIEVAARWWADQLNGTKFDNGRLVDGALAEYVKSQLPKISEEKVARFRGELINYIQNSSFCDEKLLISVDYGPDKGLSEVAKLAEINDIEYRLPWKTSMWINDEIVKVRRGYSAPTEIIYSTEKAKYS